MKKARFTLSIFSTIILRKNEQILLMKRPEQALSGGLYAFPGGGMDGKETVTTATIREASEELGITITPRDLHFMHVMHIKTDSSSEYINFFFETDVWTGTPSIMEPDKCDELTWFDTDDLPEPIMPTHKKVLELMSKKIYFSEYWWE